MEFIFKVILPGGIDSNFGWRALINISPFSLKDVHFQFCRTTEMAEFHGKFVATPLPELKLEEFAWARFVIIPSVKSIDHPLPNVEVNSEAFGCCSS